MAREILVAVDFSEGSRRAVEVAREYARLFGARLHLLHVVPPTTDPGPDARLRALAAGVTEVPTVVAVTAGTPAGQIVRYAERRHIDLIVMGTHGRTGFRRALVGSVAETVVRTARCPVVTVPARWPGELGQVDEPAHRRPCIVCGEALDKGLVCGACQAHVRGELLQARQREERAARF